MLPGKVISIARLRGGKCCGYQGGMSTEPRRVALNTSTIWEEAVSSIKGNRDLLAALSGALITLPVLAILLLTPIPIHESSELPEAYVQRLGSYTGLYWPAWLGIVLVELFGSLAILSLLADPQRPTVGTALKRALKSLPTMFVGTLLAIIAAMMFVVLVGVIAGITGSALLVQIAIVPALVGMLFIFARLSLLGPVVQLEGLLNPVAALKRSALLTKGAGWQILIFLTLLILAVRLVCWLVSAAFVIVASLLAGPSASQFTAGLLDAIAQAILATVFVAAVAGLWRQLAGPSVQSTVDKFE
jgi:hypothetical protein